MPTILVGSPISVASHSVRMSFLISSILSAESAKSRRSSTQTVTIAVFPLSEHIYTHGSAHKRLYPCLCIFASNSAFHSRLDCFSPYRVFIKWHTLPLPSLKQSGWHIKWAQKPLQCLAVLEWLQSSA